MGDGDIHQFFVQALPSTGWSDSPLVVVLTDSREWNFCLPSALMLLDDAQRERMQRKRVQGDREVLTLAYAMHRLLLGYVLDMDAASVPLWRDAAGCPRVGDDKLVHTSLSHADEFIALAISRAGPVGVDIEPMTRKDMLPEMAASICTPEEKLELDQLDAEARGLGLLAMWVRKEALLKAAGLGLSVEMNTFAAPEGLVRPMFLADGACLQMLETDGTCLAALAGPVDTRAAVVRLSPHLDSTAFRSPGPLVMADHE